MTYFVQYFFKFIFSKKDDTILKGVVYEPKIQPIHNHRDSKTSKRR